MSDFARRMSESIRNINALKPDLRVVSIETTDPLTIKVDGVGSIPAISASPVVLSAGTNNAIALMLQRSKPVVFPLDPENEWPAEDVVGRVLSLQDEEFENFEPSVSFARHRSSVLTQYGKLYQHNHAESGVTIGAWDSDQGSISQGNRFEVKSRGQLSTLFGGVVRPLPFAMATGSIVTTGAANTTRNVTVTLPTGLFTQTPQNVFVGLRSSNPQNGSVSFVSASTSQIDLYLRYSTASNITISWLAIQMTPEG